MAVQFYFPATIGLKNRNVLKAFILSIFKNEKKRASNINYIFCSDEYILQINQSFLKHDYYTDIITFDLSTPGSQTIDAEIYISVDTVRSNALQFKTTITQEIHRVIFHGVLHLCGYKDKTKQDQQLMRKKEDYYLKLYKKR